MRKHLLFITGVQSSRLGGEKKSLYKSVICCLHHAQVLPALAKPQPGSRGEQNHFLRWMREAGRAQQASLPCWGAPHALHSVGFLRGSVQLCLRNPRLHTASRCSKACHIWAAAPLTPGQLVFSHLVTVSRCPKQAPGSPSGRRVELPTGAAGVSWAEP